MGEGVTARGARAVTDEVLHSFGICFNNFNKLTEKAFFYFILKLDYFCVIFSLFSSYSVTQEKRGE